MRKLPNPPLLHLGRLWSVAVYRLSQHYGGPEEGGWSYSASLLSILIGLYQGRRRVKRR